MSGYPAGTVTFLFTDIEQSTLLWERDSAGARAMVERHLALIRQSVHAQDGVHFKTIGDATQSAFATAPRGIAAALQAQLALRDEPWPGANGRPRVRMALHAGAAEPHEGDYLAACLNRLSRLLEAAYGEQVLLSETIAHLAGDALPAGATLESLGEFRLRDILQPEEIFQLCHPTLRADFPPLKTPGRLAHNLPAHPTPFLGREREVEEIGALLLQPGVRLVTLTGPGGVGKTRLGLRVAAETLESFPDGAFIIDLARQTDPALVPTVTANVLGLREQPGQSLTETLAAYLRERRVLLLFDNFEHVLPAAMLVADLLAAAPGLTVLATSRARLGLQAEYEYQVETLPVPDPGALPPLEEIARYDAIALFVARARALRPSFALTAENAPVVVAICARLDGLPLAIELAAAQVKVLAPEALLRRLDRRLATLTGGARDLPPRQQTLRAAIAWSHDLLAPEDATLFRRLSVFAGGWTLAGAEAVSSLDGAAVDALPGISALIDQSLIDQHPRPGADDEPRYVMLETIREFASEHLAASGETAAAERAFAAFCIARAEASEEGLRGEEQALWLERMEAEHDNLRAALNRAIERADSETALRLAASLRRFWRMHGDFGEGRRWLERALAIGVADTALTARAEYGVGELAATSGDFHAAEAHLKTSSDIRRALGDTLGMAEALAARANVAVNLRQYGEAQALGEEALQIFRAQGDRRGAAGVLYDLGLISRGQGDYARARLLFEESMTAWVALGDLIWTATVALGLASLHRLEACLGAARDRLAEASHIYTRLNDRFGLATVAMEEGHLARDEGALDLAIARYGEALRYFDSIDYTEAVVIFIEYLAIVAARRGEADLAFRLIRAADAARDALRLPPLGEDDAENLAAARALISRAASSHAGAPPLPLAQARDLALHYVDRIQADITATAGASPVPGDTPDGD